MEELAKESGLFFHHSEGKFLCHYGNQVVVMVTGLFHCLHIHFV